MPSHASREVLFVLGSLSTCDPGDIGDTIKVWLMLMCLLTLCLKNGFYLLAIVILSIRLLAVTTRYWFKPMWD